MLKRIVRKRTSLEKQAWEKVEELMPRKSSTRGLYCEVLEFLFEHLYEKVSEDELREHLLEVRGHLPAKGEPVKNAVNMAIKELQRAREPEFELSKIQKPSLERHIKRYVKLNFTRFDAVVNYQQYCDYLKDILIEEKDLVLRSSFMMPPGRMTAPTQPKIFPGIDVHQLRHVRVHALINFFGTIAPIPQVNYHFIMESYSNFSQLLLYENETIEFPFLAIVSNIATLVSPEDSQYIIYRGEEKLSKLKFLHKIWHTRRELAFSMEEMEAIQKEAIASAAPIKKTHPTFDEDAFFQGILTMKFRERWELFKNKTNNQT
ncbi:MAG: hypothetical protein HQM14_10610 [SAR324 cluster bacterium]|nr:hypothetical protein [SAR324 cluster bacterium]